MTIIITLPHYHCHCHYHCHYHYHCYYRYRYYYHYHYHDYYYLFIHFLGASTLVGIGMTALSKSEIFQIFFKMFFSMIVLGLLHGLCILPVHLSIFHRLTTFTHAKNSGVLCDGDDVGDSRLKEGHINPGVEVETELHDNHVEQSANAIPSKTEKLNSAQLKGRIIINYLKCLK